MSESNGGVENAEFANVRRHLGRWRGWSEQEILDLRNNYPAESIRRLIEIFPDRKWSAIQRKAWKFGLHRKTSVPLSVTLTKDGDIGYCAGMVIADGSILETLVDSGCKRSKNEGATPRPRRYYSTPQVKVSMEDKESVTRLAKLLGRKATLCGRSSTGNDVWGVQIGGKKALELIKLMMPYLEGPKKRKAIFLLAKYEARTSLPVKSKLEFHRFEGLI